MSEGSPYSIGDERQEPVVGDEDGEQSVLLRRARLDTARVEAGLKTNPIGLPTFLLGGALLSDNFSGPQGLGRAAIGLLVSLG